MTDKGRDFALDILKGVGCLMMVVAHSNIQFRGYQPYTFWAGIVLCGYGCDSQFPGAQVSTAWRADNLRIYFVAGIQL